MTSHSNNSFSQKSRSGAKDEPEDLRQLRQAHGGSLATLRELFADWTEEDLLYSIQESGGDLELTILRISDGHATQWGEVKGKKKTPKPKSAPEKQEFRSNSRGGFAARGRGDGTRGGRGGATRGAPRTQNGGDRARPVKSDQETVVASDATVVTTEEPSTETPAWTTSTESINESTPGWGDATSSSDTTTTATTSTETTTTDSWGTAAVAPVRKLNTATIPAGSKMSWAKIVKPTPPPAPVPVPTPAHVDVTPAPAPAPAPVHIPAELKPEPIVEATPVVEEVVEAIAETEPEPVVEEKVEEKVEEPVVEATPEPEVAEPEVAQASSPKNITPVGPPGLKKSATQTRRLNQDAAVVMPSGLSALQSVGVKFGSFSLNDETETVEPEAPAPAQPTQVEQPQAVPAASPAAAATASAPAAAPAPAQPTYGRQPAAPASGYQGAPANAGTGLSPAHHHHPGMGHEAMGSPYGSYMPNPASQLGSFGMGPMASLPNDYAALYGNDIQRAMYYDPTSYGQIPVTAANSYQSRDGKYNQETSTASTSGAATTGSTQAHQTLQQQQQAYPNIAGGMPYYPYYYMPNQFPNAYQQSGYGQPFVNKNMYPMYQHQHNSNKPGAANNTPYGNYSSTAGQGHHQYSQSGYEDMSGAGIHGMGGLNNDPYGKYGNPGMQNFLGNQQQPATPTSSANNAKGNSGSNYSSGADKTAAAGSQSNTASQMAGGASLQGQPGASQGQQGYYQQQVFSNYQYQGHHQGYHPNHQGQHQGSRNQQFWGSQN
ncbi:hypothetical protein BGZ82_004216 [Podila clonocystis]|nr:hypothetical protein BGZ82_004216 [Podila clonocystis]